MNAWVQVCLTRISHHGPRWMRRKARRPRLAATVCAHRPAYSMSASGRDESRPYIPDGGHLLPPLPAPGEKCGLTGCPSAVNSPGWSFRTWNRLAKLARFFLLVCFCLPRDAVETRRLELGQSRVRLKASKGLSSGAAKPRQRFGSPPHRSLILAARGSTLWDIEGGALGSLEARWTIGNFGHGMPCPYISRHSTDL